MHGHVPNSLVDVSFDSWKKYIFCVFCHLNPVMYNFEGCVNCLLSRLLLCGSVVSFTSLSSSSSVSLFLAAIILSTMSLSVTASVVITVRRSGHNPQTAHEGGARLGECHLLGLLHRYQENRYAHWWQLLLNRRGGSSF